MESLRNQFDGWAAAWWQWALHSSWQVAVLILVVWALARLSGKSSASFRCALWLLVFVKLLVPPGLSAPWSVGTLVRWSAEPAPITVVAREIFRESNQSPLAHSPVAVELGVAPIPMIANASVTLPFPHVLLAIWLVVALAMFSLLCAQYLRYRRHLFRSTSAPPLWLEEPVRAQAAQIGLARVPNLRMTGEDGVPAVFGVFRPVLLLPVHWLEVLDPSALRNIITHELAHIKRGDLAVGWLASCLTCCYWFHPLVWVAHRQLRREREMACDDWVLRTSERDGREYAGAILKGAELGAGPLPAGAGFLGLMEVSEDLLYRIRSAGDSARKRRMGLCSALVLGLLALALLPMQAVSRAAEEDETTLPAAVPESRKAELALYEKAHPEVQAFIKHTCDSFGRSGLWLDADSLDELSPEDREKKITYIAGVLDGEYGRHQCEALAEAGVLRDARLLPGLMKVASYHRDDQDYDCRAKWMAVAALGRQGDDAIVPVLIPLVDHGNQNTRMWARGSLLRLTGQTFQDDKKAWGSWWNALGREPKLSDEQLAPWVMPGSEEKSSALPEAKGDVAPNEIGIGRDGSISIGERVGLSYEALAETLHALVKADPDVQILLRPDRETSHQHVVAVLDVVKGAGIRNVGIAAVSAAPEIVAINPAIGAAEMDPTLSVLTVTFDQDMGPGFSWTGGGELLPKTAGKPRWKDKRTCELPVELEAGKVYRLGINATNFGNFRGVNGVPARNRVLYFATKGADPAALEALVPPRVVSKEVGEKGDTLTVRFDKPMGGGGSWTKAGGNFPELTGKMQWSGDQLSCTLPVALVSGTTYRVGINSVHHVNFQSASGVPVEAEVWEFTAK